MTFVLKKIYLLNAEVVLFCNGLISDFGGYAEYRINTGNAISTICACWLMVNQPTHSYLYSCHK
jgi:hypothetical protein